MAKLQIVNYDKFWVSLGIIVTEKTEYVTETTFLHFAKHTHFLNSFQMVRMFLKMQKSCCCDLFSFFREQMIFFSPTVFIKLRQSSMCLTDLLSKSMNYSTFFFKMNYRRDLQTKVSTIRFLNLKCVISMRHCS